MKIGYVHTQAYDYIIYAMALVTKKLVSWQPGNIIPAHDSPASYTQTLSEMKLRAYVPTIDVAFQLRGTYVA